MTSAVLGATRALKTSSGERHCLTCHVRLQPLYPAAQAPPPDPPGLRFGYLEQPCGCVQTNERCVAKPRHTFVRQSAPLGLVAKLVEWKRLRKAVDDADNGREGPPWELLEQCKAAGEAVFAYPLPATDPQAMPVCECGHPIDRHFNGWANNNDRPCRAGFCTCENYRPQAMPTKEQP